MLQIYPRWPKSTIISSRADANDINKRTNKESQCQTHKPFQSCVTPRKLLQNTMTRAEKHTAQCIMNLFGRQTTALTSVDGALRLQPGEITHQGSCQSDVCSTYSNSTESHCIL